jgi:hypothetical protein
MSWAAEWLGLSAEEAATMAERCDAYDRDWKAQRREQSRFEAAREAEVEIDQSMANKALGGLYGPRCKELAQAHIDEHGRSAKSLENLRRLLRDVEGRVSG